MAGKPLPYIVQSGHSELTNVEHLFIIIIKNIRYPPGHGDIFPSLMNSGKLDLLLSQVCINLGCCT
jgi:hypothetical protein